MKRFKSLLLAAVLVAVLVCYRGTFQSAWNNFVKDLSGPLPTDIIQDPEPSVDVSLTLLGRGYAYSTLAANQQENYDRVVETLFERRGVDTKTGEDLGVEIPLPHPLGSEEEIKALFSAVRDDHPEFFYLDNHYGWISTEGLYTILRVFYLWDAEERALKAVELETEVAALVAQAQGMSAVEQERLFHDALIERCEYNTQAAESDADAPRSVHACASSAYAALVTHDPICGGYSRAFQLLLGRVGIVSTPIQNDDHVWTMVWLGDDAYHVDVTWDDPIDGVENHDYFNITDAEIHASRSYPAQQRAVEPADDTTLNYYVMNEWYFTDAFDEELDDCIRAQIESGRDCVELKFAPEAFIDAGSLLFDDEGYFEAVYALEDDALRDRWYAAILYDENDQIGTIRIYPDEAA